MTSLQEPLNFIKFKKVKPNTPRTGFLTLFSAYYFSPVFEEFLWGK